MRVSDDLTARGDASDHAFGISALEVGASLNGAMVLNIISCRRKIHHARFRESSPATARRTLDPLCGGVANNYFARLGATPIVEKNMAGVAPRGILARLIQQTPNIDRAARDPSTAFTILADGLGLT